LHRYAAPRWQVNAIAARARKAQAVWAQTSFVERRRVLSTMLQYIVDHMEEIARVCSRDSGKPSKCPHTRG
jgi:acyl-CoA reductase-like NAD-dependent aldehyde dehydrogenase